MFPPRVYGYRQTLPRNRRDAVPTRLFARDPAVALLHSQGIECGSRAGYMLSRQLTQNEACRCLEYQEDRASPALSTGPQAASTGRHEEAPPGHFPEGLSATSHNPVLCELSPSR